MKSMDRYANLKVDKFYNDLDDLEVLDHKSKKNSREKKHKKILRKFKMKENNQ